MLLGMGRRYAGHKRDISDRSSLAMSDCASLSMDARIVAAEESLIHRWEILIFPFILRDRSLSPGPYPLIRACAARSQFTSV